MTQRRDFIRTVGAITAGAIAIPGMANFALAESIEDAAKKISFKTPLEAAQDEEFWRTVRLAYSVSPSIINLNNGGVSPQVILVQDMLDKYNRLSNETPSYYMWQVLDQGREPLRERLAKVAGTDSPEEVAIDRNSTEAIETVIFGLELNEGDEVVVCKYDYPSMKNAWCARQMRHKIKMVWVDMDLPQENDDYFVKLYSNAVTSKTKVVHLTHMINWCGQMLPVRKIVDAVKAKRPDIFFLVDCAHSTALVDFKFTDLGADASGTSLHKWLCAPFGTGLMNMKKENISKIYPIFPTDKPLSDDIRKFENLGTRSIPNEMAIGYAINFHDTIGIARKQARLHYLKNYWTEQVKDIPKVSIHTSLKSEYSCAIGTFSIEGMKASDINKTLFDKYKIHTVAIEYDPKGYNNGITTPTENYTSFERMNHVRVTPNVYTTLDEIDKLVRAIKTTSAS
jgi:selenocysteine lyase/cysteine desulfurase